jgi:prepilin-type N-terminal cleavage/methylation domain-containing protein
MKTVSPPNFVGFFAKGFTLVEILVAMSVGGTLLTLLWIFFLEQSRISADIDQKNRLEYSLLSLTQSFSADMEKSQAIALYKSTPEQPTAGMYLTVNSENKSSRTGSFLVCIQKNIISENDKERLTYTVVGYWISKKIEPNQLIRLELKNISAENLALQWERMPEYFNAQKSNGNQKSWLMSLLPRAVNSSGMHINSKSGIETIKYELGREVYDIKYLVGGSDPLFYLKDTHTVLITGQMIQPGGSKRQSLKAIYAYALTPVGTGAESLF